MRYRMDINVDSVDHLIGKCLYNKTEAEWMFDILVTRNLREINLITGNLRLTQEEHADFVDRFSAEVEPTIWESSFRNH